MRHLSMMGVNQAVSAVSGLDRMWKLSLIHYPSFKEHFNIATNDPEAEARIRFLVAAEASFMEGEIAHLLKMNKKCSYADIGDSDGSVRLIMEKIFGTERLETVGINLQPAVVERMKNKGLNAICEDAIDVGNRGVRYDVVSLFETIEHLSNPIGFLQKIAPVVDERLVLSVPYVRASRVGLHHIDADTFWNQDLPISVENVHFFELSPGDWDKLFKHSGWKIVRQKVYKQFPDSGPLKWILSAYWRYLSFEGFYFVSLAKDDTYSSRYHVG